MNIKKLFNDSWFFSNQPLGTTLDDIRNNGIVWEHVDIPHDWLIYDTRNLYKTGEGWYKKRFNADERGIGNDYASIRFEGVYMDSTVYLNGKHVGDWKYGYSTFEFDISEYLVPGENEIIVRIVHQSPNTRWYSGAGIYRNIWIRYTNKNHIVSDGVYITATRQTATDWNVDIDSEIHFNTPGKYLLKHSIIDTQGNTLSSENAEICAKTVGTITDYRSITITSPKLWDVFDSNLYIIKTELYNGNECLDSVENSFGFREITFDSDKGFFINGRHQKLYGVCQHHDLGSLGAAVNKTALRRQFEILKEMGVNAIRTSHNMPAVEFMELSDEMGFLVCSEAFDMWERSKTKYDYARFFNDCVEKDVASWIRRDRNHPSIIMWSIGNEIYDTHADGRGLEITKQLKALVEQHDSKKHAPITIGSNYMPWENAQKCADVLKLAGYNYAERYYNEHHKKYPDWIIYGSETSSTVQSRGIYHFPFKQSLLSDDDEQCSSLGNSSTSWGAENTEYCIVADRDAKFSLGQFIWTGFDYIGEPTPYHTKNSYFGQIDTAGFKKDSFYIYQAEWTSYKENPMVHIFPYWDFSENQLIDVRVCSNAPKIELFFNDESLGTFNIDHEKGTRLTGDWQIRYKKGVLRAVAYDENGEIIAEDIKSSFGDAERLVLKANKTELKADGQDLIFVEITAVDVDGNAVENANNRVNINVTGAGRLIGLDNGDSTDYDQYKGTSRRMFSGKLLAIVASTDTTGEIKFTAESKNMESQTLIFTTCTTEIPEGASRAYQANTISEASDEIPIRKIELISESGNTLSKDLPNITVSAKIHPENATYNELEWRVANKSGIDSNIATIKANGNKAEISALGDGELYLRCATRNGADKPRLISQMDFSITGLGAANLNPYNFIWGGSYNASNIRLTNGNERGVATARDGESHVGFKNIDFGEYGADTLTIPIFSLNGEDFPIEIWEGMPDEEGSSQICTVIYTSGSRWNTYIEETYTLPKKLKGIKTICFVLRQKVHIKGFIFQKPERAYDTIYAKEYSQIYGDSFRLTEDCVEEIGNNVSIIFNDMDFCDKGFTKLKICGRTPLPTNSIRIQFTGDASQLVEFKNSEDYVVQEFKLKSVTGNNTVTFIFLPGCQFDFKWFKFE